MDRSEQPMGLGAVAPEVSSGGNNQGDLSNKEILQTLISCSLKGLMPKQDMAKFDGDYTKYFRFIRSFDDIFSSQLTNDKERLRYLDLYTTGRPNEIVAACLHLDASEGYRQARKLLEERYGNLEQIATAYVDKVIEWKDMGENNAEDFDEYAVNAKNLQKCISCVPYGVAELQNPKTMRLILSKFPSSVRDRWCRVADKIISEKKQTIQFDDLVSFIEGEARVLKNPLFGRHLFESGKKGTTPGLGEGSAPSKSQGLTSARKVSCNKIGEAPLSCWHCKGPHIIDECDQIAKMGHEDKLNTIKELRLCFSCLRNGHMSQYCRYRKRCNVCNKTIQLCCTDTRKQKWWNQRAQIGP
ncbi:uncharacterized protein LOC135217625 [Macrobrachium nipponense]|uniref:uncharacterized protein LOC135217625 n=1 Tax=Macrobrachium nipponense TaxID=159736 RepID=UPI0030C7FBDE